MENQARKRELARKRATLHIPSGSVLYERVVPAALILLGLCLVIIVLIVLAVVIGLIPYR